MRNIVAMLKLLEQRESMHIGSPIEWVMVTRAMIAARASRRWITTSGCWRCRAEHPGSVCRASLMGRQRPGRTSAGRLAALL